MIVLLMGVAGSGKTTVGKRLAERLGWPFYDGDDWHPAQNIQKMSQGIPLTDADRWPWLKALQQRMRDCLASEKNAIVACSALKESYRAYLLMDPAIKLFYLRASPELLQQRLQTRPSHFMKATMLESQLSDLEEPASGIHLDAALPVETLVDQIRKGLRLAPGKE